MFWIIRERPLSGSKFSSIKSYVHSIIVNAPKFPLR